MGIVKANFDLDICVFFKCMLFHFLYSFIKHTWKTIPQFWSVYISKRHVGIIFLDLICKESRTYRTADCWTEYKF
jgi:hypothetical protein